MSLQRENGFTLVEVLVAILIVGVGVLGVAGMQVVSLQQNRNALFRDTALQLGNDIIDRMSANRRVTYGPVAFDDAPSFSLDCNDNSCDEAQMLEFDLAQWKCRLDPRDADGVVFPACEALFGENPPAAALPGGRGRVTGAGDYEVTVEWIADRDGNRSQVILRARVF